MEQDFKKLIEQCQRTNQDVNEIKTILIGSPLDDKDDGVLGKIREHEEEIEKLRNLKNKGMWIIVGLSLGGGWGIASLLGKLADILIKH